MTGMDEWKENLGDQVTNLWMQVTGGARAIPDSFQQDPKPAWNPAKRHMGEPLNLRWIQGWSISGKSCYLGFQMILMYNM